MTTVLGIEETGTSVPVLHVTPKRKAISEEPDTTVGPISKSPRRQV